MEEKIVLLYGLGEQSQPIALALQEWDMEAKVVPEDQCGQKIGFLCGLPGYRRQKHADSAPGERAPLMLFCCQDEEALHSALGELRSRGLASGVLKATLTPTNAEWTLAALAGEVYEEHQVMEALMALRRYRSSLPMPDITDIPAMTALMQAEMLFSGTREVSLSQVEQAKKALEAAFAGK